MRPETAASLDKLSALTWFDRVGEPLNDHRVVQVRNWIAAIAECASSRWGEVEHTVREGYRNELMRRAIDRWRHWNEVADEMTPATEALVLEKTAKIIAQQELPLAFLNSVKYDIFHFAMECEFCDVMPAGFFTALSFFYAEGQFPCG